MITVRVATVSVEYTIPCPMCEGTGRIEVEDRAAIRANSIEQPFMMVDCDACGAVGTLDIEYGPDSEERDELGIPDDGLLVAVREADWQAGPRPPTHIETWRRLNGENVEIKVDHNATAEAAAGINAWRKQRRRRL